MTQEALKLALEALYFLPALSPAQNELQDAAIEAIKEALRENAMREVQRLGQEIEQEPVKWADYEPDGVHHNKPPQRTWVGLTDEEYNEIWRMDLNNKDIMDKTIAKLKEKNT